MRYACERLLTPNSRSSHEERGLKFVLGCFIALHRARRSSHEERGLKSDREGE